MAKTAFNKKYTLSATGIISIDNEIVSIENVDTGELIPLSKLMEYFENKMVDICINCEEDCILNSVL